MMATDISDKQLDLCSLCAFSPTVCSGTQSGTYCCRGMRRLVAGPGSWQSRRLRSQFHQSSSLACRRRWSLGTLPPAGPLDAYGWTRPECWKYLPSHNEHFHTPSLQLSSQTVKPWQLTASVSAGSQVAGRCSSNLTFTVNFCSSFRLIDVSSLHNLT
jgi:hypothetical protein